jgi:hypothetical protein
MEGNLWRRMPETSQSASRMEPGCHEDYSPCTLSAEQGGRELGILFGGAGLAFQFNCTCRNPARLQQASRLLAIAVTAGNNFRRRASFEYFGCTLRSRPNLPTQNDNGIRA